MKTITNSKVIIFSFVSAILLFIAISTQHNYRKNNSQELSFSIVAMGEYDSKVWNGDYVETSTGGASVSSFNGVRLKGDENVYPVRNIGWLSSPDEFLYIVKVTGSRNDFKPTYLASGSYPEADMVKSSLAPTKQTICILWLVFGISAFFTTAIAVKYRMQ